MASKGNCEVFERADAAMLAVAEATSNHTAAEGDASPIPFVTRGQR
jgi:hypothetical protein